MLIQTAKMRFLRIVARRILEGAQTRAIAPWHQKEPLEVVWATDQDACGTRPLTDIVGMSILAKALVQAQDSLEKLQISLGL